MVSVAGYECGRLEQAPKHGSGRNAPLGRRAWTAGLLGFVFLGLGPCGMGTEASDINRDGYVDALDSWRVARCLRRTPEAAGCAAADVDSSGAIDLRDLAVVLHHLGTVLFEPQWPAFTPDSIQLGRRGVLYLHSADQNRIYRWSLSRRKALRPLEIGADSRFVTTSGDTDQVYVAYGDGRITQIEPGSDGGEQPFAELTRRPRGLAMAGDFVFTVDDAGAWVRHYTFAPDGTLANSREWNHESREYTWSPVTQRLYFTRHNNELYYETIDPETGEIGPPTKTPFRGDYGVRPPIRVTPDGSLVLAGTGRIYDALSLEVQSALRIGPADAAWLPDNRLLTLRRHEESETLLRFWDQELETLDLRVYPGTPLRIVRSSGRLHLVTLRDGVPELHRYRPGNDGDGDGVPFELDAFPLDAFASRDSDHDGAPDAWNPGTPPSAGETNLVVDAFPLDSACQLDEHAKPGEPEACDIAAQVPAYEPDGIEADPHGTVYLLNTERQLVYRWSMPEARPLNPIPVGFDARYIAFSATHDRLYVTYRNGIVTRFDPHEERPTERPFASTFGRAFGMHAIDPFLMVAGESTLGFRHHTFSEEGETLSILVTRGSSTWSWVRSVGRLYLLEEGVSPRGMLYDVIDPNTGVIETVGVDPYHGDFSILPPVRASRDGARVVVGSGDVFDGETLEIQASLPVWFYRGDALWLEDGSFVTLRDDDGRSLLEHWDADRRRINVQAFEGTPLRFLEAGPRLVVVTSIDGRPSFDEYAADGDGDRDGIDYANDAFPLDPAASEDADGDGAPDRWNAGAGEATSTQGLRLDAFPEDSACQLPEHALPEDPSRCDIAGRVPTYAPTQLAIDADGTVYLSSAENRKVFRWSAASETHMNPIVTRDDPEQVAYSEALERLFISHPRGGISQVDLSSPTPRPIAEEFTASPGQALALIPMGDRLFVIDSSGRTSHLTFAGDGRLLDHESRLYARNQAEWSDANQRLYYFGLGSFYAEDIDLATGDISDRINTRIRRGGPSPIRAAPDGSRLIFADGYLIDANSLELIDVVKVSYEDALWIGDELISIRSDEAGGTVLEQWSPDFDLHVSRSYPGEPLRVFEWNGAVVVVTQDLAQPAFAIYEPTDDGDGDGVPNAEDGFPLDPAASLDRDGDGAPDEWNPGAGPEDSTQGLVIDVFPDDFACQLAEHELNGDCDFVQVIPRGETEPVCPSDTLTPDTESGVLEYEVTSAFLPLCDGWIVISDLTNRQVVIQNVFHGRFGARYELGEDPGDIALDDDRKWLYVALPQTNGLVAIDLLTDEITRFALEGSPDSLALRPDGLLFMSVDLTGYGQMHLYALEAPTSTPIGGWPIDGPMLRYNASANELIAAVRGRSPAGLYRYAFDITAGPTLLQSVRDAGSNGRDIALTPDGERLAFAAGGGNGAGYTIFDFDATDLETHQGEWVTGPYPAGVAFDSLGLRLLALAYQRLMIFDASNYALLDEIPLSRCLYWTNQPPRFSRGDRYVFVRQDCRNRQEGTRFLWFDLE